MANIRTARRSGLVLRGGRNVRETLWGDVVGTNNVLASPSTAVLANVTGSVFLNLRPFTIVRARGFLHLMSDQEAASELQAVNFGICVASDQAVLIGITALPTPTTDQGSDLWQTFVTLMAAHGAGTVDSQRGVGVAYDSKAMRRVEDGAQLVFVAESEVNTVSGGLIVRHTGRVLIKLH